MSLKGKTAIVTGGSRGIGRAIALRLAKDGANIGVLNLQKDLGLKVAEEIREFGVEAIPLVCDLTDYNMVKTSVERIHQEWGSIDILINNAGIDESRYFVETDEGLWEKIINVNYKSFLIASHVCIPIMMRQKSGNIVSLGSDAGRIGNPGEVPGPVQTDLWNNLHSGEKGQKYSEAVTRVIPLRRLGEPEDVADVVAFFVSDDSRYLTGQVLSIDGGLTMIG
jgi:2-hydroxycyclohexanecarboxyl-CoA dehydrogenase